MLEWHIAYRCDQTPCMIEAGKNHAAAMERFASAEKAKQIDGREILEMWLIHAAQQDDVIAIYGHVPPHIRGGHEA